MKSEQLVIIFVKNVKAGMVKTRLAKTIGNEEAVFVYTRLLDITEQATAPLKMNKRISFSETRMESRWPHDEKTVQNGVDLGERMKNAFKNGFADGYKKIVLIGSDLPEISSVIIEDAFSQLNNADTVFGPADDGGYYLIGMSEMNSCIFENKPWSQPNLLEKTLAELRENKITTHLLSTLNDVDTFEDLKNSCLYIEYCQRNTQPTK